MLQPQPIQDSSERYVVDQRGTMRCVHDMTREEALFVAKQYEERAHQAAEKVQALAEKAQFFRAFAAQVSQ